MRKDYATKTIIIHILTVVQKLAREEHPASFTEIARYLSDSGKPCDRRTVQETSIISLRTAFPLAKPKTENVFIN